MLYLVILVMFAAHPVIGDKTLCDRRGSKRWKFSVDISVPTCRLPNGDDQLEFDEMSDEDFKEFLDLYPGLFTKIEDLAIPTTTQRTTTTNIPATNWTTTPGLKFLEPPGAGFKRKTARAGKLNYVVRGDSIIIDNDRGDRRDSGGNGGGNGFDSGGGLGVSGGGIGGGKGRTGSVGCQCPVLEDDFTKPDYIGETPIVQFRRRGVFQFVPVRKCRTEGSSCGDGLCGQDYLERYLAVPGTQTKLMTFKSFRIESGCSCKNVG